MEEIWQLSLWLLERLDAECLFIGVLLLVLHRMLTVWFLTSAVARSKYCNAECNFGYFTCIQVWFPFFASSITSSISLLKVQSLFVWFTAGFLWERRVLTQRLLRVCASLLSQWTSIGSNRLEWMNCKYWIQNLQKHEDGHLLEEEAEEARAKLSSVWFRSK